MLIFKKKIKKSGLMFFKCTILYFLYLELGLVNPTKNITSIITTNNRYPKAISDCDDGGVPTFFLTSSYTD
jgi:hypothetical protein